MRLSIPILALALFIGGCATLDPGQSALVVRTEQTLKIAGDTFDLFLNVEHQNHALLFSVNPAIHETAERFRADQNGNGRQDALDWLYSLNAVKLEYKRNRSQTNQTALITALATLEFALHEAQQYLSIANNAKGTR